MVRTSCHILQMQDIEQNPFAKVLFWSSFGPIPSFYAPIFVKGNACSVPLCIQYLYIAFSLIGAHNVRLP